MLSKCAKLYEQCNGLCKEADDNKIALLDHDPKIFALLLEFLYRNDYWPFWREQESIDYRSSDMDVRATQLRREGELYCLAEYYQLDQLQELIVEKMQFLTPIYLKSFLSVSEYIYSNTTTTAGPFHNYFRNQIKETLPLVVREPWLLGIVAKGGDLAADLFLAGHYSEMNADRDLGPNDPPLAVTWEREEYTPLVPRDDSA